MNTIAFAARKLADKFLLIGTGEIEFRDVSSGIHLAFPKRYKIKPVRDLVEHRLVRIRGCPATDRRNRV